MRKSTLILLAILFQISCFGQSKTDKLRLIDFNFKSIFGYQKSDSSNIYCLLGQGFFRTPSSDNSDSMINDWILNHKNAQIIPISSFGPTMTDQPNSRMIYCWIINSIDTLNITLIRQGCFPGGTMQRPQTWNEMEKWEKELYKDTDKPNVQVYISDKEYESFIKRIMAAEKYAKKNKLGIWNENNEK
jgi:hypothetical protein